MDRANATRGASPPRLGFAGLGWIGRMRLEALLASGRGRAVALAEPSEELAREAAELAPEARVVDTFEELLALGREGGLDGVVIATPSALHAAQSEAALAAGLHVFCQKPLGRSGGEVRRVVEAARAADRLLGVDFVYRRLAAVRAVRELVAAGRLGRVYAARAVFHNAYGPDREWFYRRELSGGGCVMDLGVHLVDLVLRVLADPDGRPPAVRRVEGRCFAGGRLLPAPVPDGAPVEDYGVARLDLTVGGGVEAVVEVACSWNLHAGREAVIGLELWGTGGGAAVRNVGGSFYDFEAEQFEGTTRRTLVSPPDDWGGRSLVAWAERLAERPGYDPEIEGAVTVAEVVDRIYGR
jgi:predicted dehydrogenase